jgi:glycerol-3-phosphate dehydrogenase
MQNIQTEVLVIGGGATGAGTARDLAMRGFDTILVEKRDYSHGTTGRYHGLLHSGGRYVVKDPQAARECIEENQILRKIMPFCIEDTGGFFILTPWDDPQYVPLFVNGCKDAGIPIEEVSIHQMLIAEPLLNPAISHCFRVPDASADSFLATQANVESARQHGARILNYHQVTDLLLKGDKVIGTHCRDLVKDEDILISADMVINATGAWAGHIGSMVKINIPIIPGKGTLVAVNRRIVHTVINRCKSPSDGDIIVPAHTVSVLGTTDVPVDNPDRFSIEPWEVHLLLEEGEKVIPGLQDMRILRAWAGVRPLYAEQHSQDDRQLTRAFVLLDHETRDGVSGMVTITGGKWTTFRKMAEITVDLVCAKLKVERDCRTHLEQIVIDHDSKRYHHLGARLAKVEKEQLFGELVCECELATVDEVAQAITSGQARSLDDVRRDVRLGMGPCQGGFCTYRIAGMLHDFTKTPVTSTNAALRDFLQSRWKGLLPILWGQQLRQERLDELIYLSTLNVDHLPGPRFSRLGSEDVDITATSKIHDTLNEAGNQQTRLEQTSTTDSDVELKDKDKPIRTPCSSPAHHTQASQFSTPDVLVIGAGLAGLVTAWQAGQHGLRIRLISKGWGATHWHSGCIDILGYYPLTSQEALVSPLEGLEQLTKNNPRHPYAIAGLKAVESAILAFQDLCNHAHYPMHGSLERNWRLPSAVGAFRPTCLAPETMIAGDLTRPDPMLLVGFEGLVDFYPGLIAANLSEQGIPAEAVTISPSQIQGRRFTYPHTLASLFESNYFQAEVAQILKPKISSTARVGFPAVLGLDNSLEAKRNMEELLGCEVFEIPGLPPSIPGIRLHNLLVSSIEAKGNRVYNGMEAVAADSKDHHITTVWSEAASRRRANHASRIVLTTGGILGGGIQANYGGAVREVVFDLPLEAPREHEKWFDNMFLSQEGHPIYRTGLSVNGHFQPIDQQGQVVYENIYAAGTLLANSDCLQERSFDGIGLVSGFVVGNLLADNNPNSST